MLNLSLSAIVLQVPSVNALEQEQKFDYGGSCMVLKKYLAGIILK